MSALVTTKQRKHTEKKLNKLEKNPKLKKIKKMDGDTPSKFPFKYFPFLQ